MVDLIDRTGRTFGYLTVISYAGNRKWNCRCACGAVGVWKGKAIAHGNTKSCGCMKSWLVAAPKIKHGMAGSKQYLAWNGMIQRCTNPNHASYSDYGGRGITVCDRWLKFENFYADMGDKPTGLTLERKNNNKGYTKSNCVWATYEAQANNRRKRKVATPPPTR